MGFVQAHGAAQCLVKSDSEAAIGAALQLKSKTPAMNLVAKEFVAAREDLKGVLVLSEFAGAAQELRDAVIINPYDVEGFADGLQTALDMPDDERHRRMRALRRVVAGRDVFRWASDILEGLDKVDPRARLRPPDRTRAR